MDLNDVRIIWTVASFLVFLAIVAWAYSRGARQGFDEAAQLPFLDEAAGADGQRQAAGAHHE
jgi:cytochrome c oxidase cbb3-type subunit 4